MYYNVNATDSVNEVIKIAQSVAEKYNNNLISTEHLFYGILSVDSDFKNFLASKNITKENFIELLQQIEEKDENESNVLDLTPTSKQIFVIAKQISNQLQQTNVDVGHMLFAILLLEDCVAVQLLVQDRKSVV